MISSGINLVMTVIGFAVSTMFIVFVCTRLICARIQLRASRRSFPAASRSDLSVLERGLHGLEPAVVASFPTKKFSDQFFSSRQQTQCTICLAEYQEKDVLRILPYCGHAFHVTCIDIWLKQHSTCPMCRISLRESPDRRRTMQPVHSAAIRSLYSQESFHLDSYHALHEGHDSHPTESTLEGQLISEPSGQMESGSVEVDCSSKTVGHHDPQGKYMESPSDS